MIALNEIKGNSNESIHLKKKVSTLAITRKASLLGLIFNGLAFMSFGVYAATTTQSLTQAVSVKNSCVIQSATTQVGTTGVTYTFPVSTSGSDTALTATSTSSKTLMPLTYYGKVPNGQDEDPGTYLDTVTVQVTF